MTLHYASQGITIKGNIKIIAADLNRRGSLRELLN
jgi:hypothetical protein